MTDKRVYLVALLILFISICGYLNFRNGNTPANSINNLSINKLSYYVSPGQAYTLITGYDDQGNTCQNLINVHLKGQSVKLDLPTPAIDDTDGLGSTGQVVHPDVLYFSNGWKGYKYWMLITGYYKSLDQTENPYLFCSNDGLTWVVPNGVVNPINPAPGLPSFTADPDLIYDSAHDRLVCYYIQERIVGSGITLVRFRYYNGNSISQEYTLNNGTYDLSYTYPNNGAGSPSFVYNSTTGKTYCFGVMTQYNPNKIYRWDSTDGINFYNRTEIPIRNAPSNALDTMDLWHLNIEALSDGTYNCMCCMADMNTTGTNGTLYFGTMASIDSPIIINQTPLITISNVKGAWDNNRIYRSSSVTNLTTNTMKVWYSACGNVNGGTYNYWGLGYMEFSKNDTGVWVPKALDVTFPKVRISTYHNAGNTGNSNKNSLVIG